MTKDKKLRLLISLNYRDHIKKGAYENRNSKTSLEQSWKEQTKLFWKENPITKEDLISFVKKNGLPKKSESKDLKLGLGVDYYFKNGEWKIVYYERGGPIGSKTVKDPLEVVNVLINDEFRRYLA